MCVWVVSTSAVLAAAFAAGLVAAGWWSARSAAVSDLSATADPQWGGLVVVADDREVPELPTPVYRAAPVVVVVSDRHSSVTSEQTAAGAVLVDASQPLLSQLRAVAHTLNRDGERSRASTRQPPGELARVATLTRRETEILDSLMAGASANEVADALVVSLSTVRTHIRSILTKLDVSSQIAAVALACRARCQPWARRCENRQY